MEISFKKYLESYNQELVYLRNYLRDRPLSTSDYGYQFLQWPGNRPILNRAKISPEQLRQWWDEGKDDKYYQAHERIDQAMTPDEREAFINHLAFHDPAEAPTWAHMNYNKVLPPQTWLIHFSDDAQGIWDHGFKYGMDDISKLGLTTWWSKNAKKYGGYNFAFIADSRYARNAARKSKYGNEAIMFQAAGVEAYHYGDQEDQVMFYGPSVPTSKLVYLRKEYDNWCVAANTRMWSKTNRNCAYSTEDFDNAVAWVMKNHRQYAKHIYG